MKFNDQGIIIGLRKYGENSLIVKIFSRHNGIYSGFVKFTKSSKVNPIFQIGNLVSFEYRAKFEENLGQFFALDLVKSYCGQIIFERLKLDCINALFSLIDSCFFEREHHEIFNDLESFLQQINQEISDQNILAQYIKLELKILENLGYGIDLSCCVATQEKTNLAFVSPKSGRAVSLNAGKIYENKLLKLPKFLTENSDPISTSQESDFTFQNTLSEQVISSEDIFHGLKLSGFFLKKYVLGEIYSDNASSKLVSQLPGQFSSAHQGFKMARQRLEQFALKN